VCALVSLPKPPMSKVVASLWEQGADEEVAA
jgi:hypothetical protein